MFYRCGGLRAFATPLQFRRGLDNNRMYGNNIRLNRDIETAAGCADLCLATAGCTRFAYRAGTSTMPCSAVPVLEVSSAVQCVTV